MDDFVEFFRQCRSILLELKPRRFRPSQEIVSNESLDCITNAFMTGHDISSEVGVDQLKHELALQPMLTRGVSFEGAGFGLALMDFGESGDDSRVEQLLTEMPEQKFVIQLGLGGALSHYDLSPNVVLQRMGKVKSFDPFFSWLMFDGYGMHQGYFKFYEAIALQKRPEGLSAMQLHAFDQGIGRSLWFICAGVPELVRDFYNDFPPERRPDLWRGLGIVIGYSGGADEKTLVKLSNYSGRCRRYFQLGIIIGNKARVDGATGVPDHTEGACSIVCGAESMELVELANSCMADLNPSADELMSYWDWQKAILARL